MTEWCKSFRVVGPDVDAEAFEADYITLRNRWLRIFSGTKATESKETETARLERETEPPRKRKHREQWGGDPAFALYDQSKLAEIFAQGLPGNKLAHLHSVLEKQVLATLENTLAENANFIATVLSLKELLIFLGEVTLDTELVGDLYSELYPCAIQKRHVYTTKEEIEESLKTFVSSFARYVDSRPRLEFADMKGSFIGKRVNVYLQQVGGNGQIVCAAYSGGDTLSFYLETKTGLWWGQNEFADWVTSAVKVGQVCVSRLQSQEFVLDLHTLKAKARDWISAEGSNLLLNDLWQIVVQYIFGS
jgi:hypothetical protein